MHATAGKEHRVSRAHGDAMKAIRHFPAVDRLLEVIARNSSLETDEQFCTRIRGRDVPHLRLWLAEMCCPLGRVDLERQAIASVEDLAQQWKAAFRSRRRSTEHFGCTLVHQRAQRPACQRAVGND